MYRRLNRAGRDTVNDRELWALGCAAVVEEFALLPPEVRERIDGLAYRVKEVKGRHVGISAGTDGAAICADCRGKCCAHGKNHVTVVDLLVHIGAGRPMVVPDFDRDGCPYSGEAGCLMPPPYRPFNCIIFNCERIEGLLDPSTLAELYRSEEDLRELYRQFDELLGSRFGAGLLINAELRLSRQRSPLFRPTHTDGERHDGSPPRPGTRSHR